MLWCHRLSEETHEVAQRKLDQMAKLRSAMGLSEVREGEAFDPEAMAARREAEKAARQAERERREVERQVRGQHALKHGSRHRCCCGP
jgi:serine/arginine repetitive matrix protein 2